MAAKAKMATAACSGWPIPLRSHGVANATALTVAASRSDAEIRATATRNAPRPALAKRRSAPRDELTWKKPSAPDKNAAAQPALIAVAERSASVPPSASAKVPKTPAKINTKKAGTATSNASVSGARNCSRTKLPLVAASAVKRAPPSRPSIRRRGRGGRARSGSGRRSRSPSRRRGDVRPSPRNAGTSPVETAVGLVEQQQLRLVHQRQR